MAGEHTMSLSLEGVEELVQSLESLSKKYPDRAGELLQKNAKALRKEVVKNVKAETEPRKPKKNGGTPKKQLHKISSYAISPIQGYGANQFVEVSAKSPHFHLVEHGHVLKSRSGNTIGFVQGKHMMDNAIKKAENEMPDTLEEMVTQLLKEEGFL